MPAVPKTKEDTAEVELPAPEVPEFTLKNVVLDVYRGLIALFIDPFVNRIIIPIVVTLSSIATKLIIANVPYTEIDFKTYIQQIQLVNGGELDYSQISGDTGPIVYPAGFVQVYQVLNWITDNGKDIGFGQSVFGYVFVATTFLTCVVYSMVPDFQPWPIYLLILSKRLYSIYVLRLFNDCFTTLAMVGVTLLLQQASYWHSTVGSTITFLLTIVAADLYSLAISVKMNALLYLPGFIIVSYFLVDENLLKLLVVVAVIPFIQVLVGWKFLLPTFFDEEASYIRWTYLNQAFNFLRKFLYEWTVNWKFVPEETFLSDNFSNTLLIGHVSVLLFVIFTRFLSPKVTGKSLTQLVKDLFLKPFQNTVSPQNLVVNHTVGPKIILLILSTTNLIGVLFSRSLHYQFLSWYAWHLPFMIYAAGFNVVVGIPFFLIHEWCWNVFPSTPVSSAVLVASLSVLLAGIWNNTLFWFGETTAKKTD